MTSSLRTLPVLLTAALATVLSGCGGDNLARRASGGQLGFCGLIHVVLCVWALVQIANSAASVGSKLLWGALVFFFPVGGLLIWYFAGPRG